MNTDTFSCDFGGGIACSVHIEFAPNKQLKYSDIEWTGKPTPEVLRSYMEWMAGVVQTLADKHAISITHVFQTSRHIVEPVLCKPGGKPEWLEKMPI